MFSRSPSANSRKRSSKNSRVREHVVVVWEILSDLAPEMGSQAVVAGADTEIMKSPLAQPFMGDIGHDYQERSPSLGTQGSPLEDVGGKQNAFANAGSWLFHWRERQVTPSSMHTKIQSYECTTNPLLTGNARTLQSLTAALETSPAEVEERLRVISVQSSVYSQGSYQASETGEDAFSVVAFLYPPAQIPHS
ncbi:hypothetical protein BKA82DRAFT_22429 [Pisolithus tinctorius]|uniref:Uncharacterized protein n=1 Tax=Pisolithus tinctorius Marx 270 TaxID=870435 RepID=A0A0C3KI24_PISTI|nr:hypothetical protein BKA82DRAFT_22429 [Pisolithus tinctorius]KIO09247.1 hypothetical protein M404DRAFT_22429 [Pisolithus tinctorius Marx 270]